MGNKNEPTWGGMVNKGADWVKEQTPEGRREKQKNEMNALAVGAAVVVGIPLLAIGGTGWLIWQGVKKAAKIGQNISGGGDTEGISDNSNPPTPAG